MEETNTLANDFPLLKGFITLFPRVFISRNVSFSIQKMFSLDFKEKEEKGCCDTEHNDTEHNDTKYKGTVFSLIP